MLEELFRQKRKINDALKYCKEQFLKFNCDYNNAVSSEKWYHGDNAIYTRRTTGATSTTSTNYLHKDHLGSMQCITDETGHMVQELSYDAWGNRRDVDTWDVFTTLPTGILLARGFTGHEHIDLFDLINMDGRVYDPVLGRFLSPDPIIQNPDNLQSLNRYTYCLNNPLSLTDPSGYSWLSDNWRSLAAAAVAISVSAISFGAATPLGAAIIAGAAGGFAGGVTGALLSGADLGQAFKAGIIGGLIGAVSGLLNFASGCTEFAKGSTGALLDKAAKHAFSNAWLNGMTGGDIKHGFITGALSSMGNGLIDEKADGFVSKVACASALGGTIEEVGGGKFANGAITGAYGMLYNELMHGNDDPEGEDGGTPDKGKVNFGNKKISSQVLKERLEEFADKNGYEIKVIGGDRSVESNDKVGGTSKSRHLYGDAADISVKGRSNREVAIQAKNSGLFKTTIYYPVSNTPGALPPHVHVDMNPGHNNSLLIYQFFNGSHKYNPWKP